jgi:hypothetical protein
VDAAEAGILGALSQELGIQRRDAGAARGGD